MIIANDWTIKLFLNLIKFSTEAFAITLQVKKFQISITDVKKGWLKKGGRQSLIVIGVVKFRKTFLGWFFDLVCFFCVCIDIDPSNGFLCDFYPHHENSIRMAISIIVCIYFNGDKSFRKVTHMNDPFQQCVRKSIWIVNWILFWHKFNMSLADS